MQNTIYASFDSSDQAVKAAGALLDYGVKNEDLTIISKGTESEVKEDGTTVPREQGNGDDDGVEGAEGMAKNGISTTTPGDAAAGAAKGAGIGLATGVIAGLASLLVPGFGLVIGGGALATAITGAAIATAGGGVVGGVAGYLKDQGVPEEHIAAYDKAISSGGAIVVVTMNSDKIDTSKVTEVLNKYGATNITDHK